MLVVAVVVGAVGDAVGAGEADVIRVVAVLAAAEDGPQGAWRRSWWGDGRRVYEVGVGSVTDMTV